MEKYNFEYCMKHICDGCKNGKQCENQEKNIRRKRNNGDKEDKHKRIKTCRV